MGGTLDFGDSLRKQQGKICAKTLHEQVVVGTVETV